MAFEVTMPRLGWSMEVGTLAGWHKKDGDRVEAGEPLFTVHASDEARLAQACQPLLEAHAWCDTPVEPLPLFYGVIR